MSYPSAREAAEVGAMSGGDVDIELHAFLDLDGLASREGAALVAVAPAIADR